MTAGTYVPGGMVNDPRSRVRATYTNLYKGPESDAEFLKRLASSKSNVRQGGMGHPSIVDSFSCRRVFLESYTFSTRKETVSEKIAKCLVGPGGLKDKFSCGRGTKNNRINSGKRFPAKRLAVLRKAKEASCASLSALFKKLLTCTPEID